MPDSSWQLLMSVFDTLSAQVLVERLNNEGVQTQLRTDSSLLGAARRCDIFVPGEMLNRARSLLAFEQLSDSELADLATGKVNADRAEEP